MPIILFLLSIILVSYVAFCIFIAKGSNIEVGKYLFFSLVATCIIAIAITTGLAVIGVYSLLVLGIILILSGFSGLLILIKHKLLVSPVSIYKEVDRNAIKLRTWSICGIIAISAFLYLCFPVNFLFGSRDPGTYVLMGVNISKHGSVQVPEDEFLTRYPELLGINEQAHIVYPGVYTASPRGLSENAGDMVFAFMPLLSAALAIGYDIGGVEALLRTPGIIGILALLAIYFFTKKAFGFIPAFIAVTLMLVNPAQLWGARITQTEILSQLLIFLAIYAFFEAWRRDSVKLSVLAGILIGIGGLNRIDVFILGLSVFALLMYTALFRREKIKISLYLACSTVLLFIVSLLYGYYYSNPYLIDHWFILRDLISLNLLFAFASVLCLIISWLLRNKLIKNVVIEVFDSRSGRWIISGALLLVFLFAYFIRPTFDPGSFISNAMVEFCWYTSFIALPLSILGIHSILKKDFPYREELFLFLLIGLPSMIGYIHNPAISWDHIWASRRWVTFNIPFIIILASYGIYMLSIYIKPRVKKLSIIIPCICAIWMFGFAIYQASPFIVKTMLKGINNQYIAATEYMNKDALYFTGNQSISAMLKFVYGFDTYEVRMNMDEITELLDTEKRDIYLIADHNFFTFFPMTIRNEYIRISEFIIGGDYLELTRGEFPRALFAWEMDLRLYRVIRKDTNEFSIELDLNSGWIGTQNGTKSDNTITSNGNPGYLMFGPYISLESGFYELSVEIDLLSTLDNMSNQAELGSIDIVTTYYEIAAPVAFTSEDLQLNAVNGTTSLIKLTFDLQDDADMVEFRLFTNEGVFLRINKVTLTRMPAT